jgi:hypothetical protein
MVMAMCALSNGLIWINSPERVVNWVESPPSEKWNSFSVLSGLPTLMEVPGCSKAVIENIGPGLDLLLWRPFIVGGLSIIFLGTSRGSKYWLIQFEKLRFLLTGRSKIKALILLVVARVCYYLPPLRILGGWCFRMMRLLPPDIEKGLGRL